MWRVKSGDFFRILYVDLRFQSLKWFTSRSYRYPCTLQISLWYPKSSKTRVSTRSEKFSKSFIDQKKKILKIFPGRVKTLTIKIFKIFLMARVEPNYQLFWKFFQWLVEILTINYFEKFSSKTTIPSILFEILDCFRLLFIVSGDGACEDCVDILYVKYLSSHAGLQTSPPQIKIMQMRNITEEMINIISRVIHVLSQ